MALKCVVGSKTHRKKIRQECNWEQSMKGLYGMIVIISNDNFVRTFVYLRLQCNFAIWIVNQQYLLRYSLLRYILTLSCSFFYIIFSFFSQFFFFVSVKKVDDDESLRRRQDVRCVITESTHSTLNQCEEIIEKCLLN